ncbi:hypothetical protein L7F22_006981 [Adiantum nelumboides]|nr:hypothetical protein [Adiantum nelumboides]
MASDDDIFSDADELEEGEEDDDADEDVKRSLRRKSYEKHLPELKSLLKETFGDSKPNLVTDRTEKCCAVCPTLQWFKGWKALLGHAETFKKKRIQQHRGYADAIREALRVHGTSTLRSDIVPTETRTASLNPEAASSHVIVWPPILLVETMDRRVDLHEFLVGVLSKEFPNICLPQFIHIRSYRGLLVFRAEAVGYLEAKRVSRLFSELNKRGDQNSRVQGDVSTSKEMSYIDPERKLVKWTEESYYSKVQQAQKEEKEASQFAYDARDLTLDAYRIYFQCPLEPNSAPLFVFVLFSGFSLLAQKAVAKELEVMQRKENFMAERARAETIFNERARKRESELQAKQHLEEMKLMEELKRERENLLQEWLEKQKNVKKEEEQPVQEEASECCSCMDALDEHNRAFLRPCGHAKICLECALSIYKSQHALCPFCRQKISKKPTLLPKYYI